MCFYLEIEQEADVVCASAQRGASEFPGWITRKRGRLRARTKEPINPQENILLYIYTSISAEACSQVGSSVTPDREPQSVFAQPHGPRTRVHLQLVGI